MAATVGNLFLREVLADGKLGAPKTLSIYNTASLAAGNYVPIDWNAPAVATSPTEFSVKIPMQVVDFVPTAATGTVEFTSDGLKTNVVLDYALFGATNPNRPRGSLPALRPGVSYRVLVIADLVA